MNVRRVLVAAAVLVSVTAPARSASAQGTDAPADPPPAQTGPASQNPPPAETAPPAQPAAPPPGVIVRWNNGMQIETPDGNNRLHFGTLLNLDGKFTTDTNSAIVDSFYLRRGRFLLRGRVAKYFELYIVPDFTGERINLIDEYMDTRFTETFRLRFGKQKSPVGLEQLYSDPSLPFAERSLANNLAPNRDPGLDAQGSAFKGRISYIGGIRDGANDGQSFEADTNNAKEAVGRLTVNMGPIGVAVGGSHGNTSGALPGFKTFAGQNFFAYGIGVAADGMRNRISPSAFMYHKWYGGYAEYLQTTQAVVKGSTTADVTNHSWNVTAIAVLTREPLTDRGTAPKYPFDPSKGHWGALQVAARASGVTLDSDIFSLGMAVAGSSRVTRAYAIGIDWINTATIKHLLTYEHTAFDPATSGGRKAENAIIVRVQLNLSSGGGG